MPEEQVPGQITQSPAAIPQPGGVQPSVQVTKSVSFQMTQNFQKFNSLYVLPKEKSYGNLEMDEKVIFFIYRHPIVLFDKIILGLFLALVPVITLLAMFFAHPGVLLIRIIVFLMWYWVCFVLVYCIATLVSYRADVFLVTNERIINFDLYNLTARQVEDISLESIQDIQHSSGSGILKGKLDYGNITVLIPGRTLEMNDIPMPDKIAMALGELVEEKKKNG